MSDDLRLLRQGLSELAEEGGNADLYDRVLRTSHKLKVRRRVIASSTAAAVVGLAAVVPLALRPSSDEHPPPAASRTSTTTSPVTPPPTTPPPVTSVSASCPVRGETLLAALKTTDMYARAGKPGALLDVVCYGAFASARDAGGGQPNRILFGFDAATGRWKPLNVGSANYCAGFVPAEVASHMPGCGETRSSTPGTTRPRTTPPSIPHGNADSCPASTGTLLAALKASPEFYAQLGRPGALYRPECGENHAVAYTTGSDSASAGWAFFEYTPATRSWNVLAVGAGSGCVLISPSTGGPPVMNCD